MLTRDDFNDKYVSLLEKYPELKARHDAGDPTLSVQIEGIFTAFAMLSADQEVALAEPHAKTRPATVLADAALRGIIPKSRPSVVQVSATNASTTNAFTIEQGRTVFDTAGISYRAVAAQTIQPGETETVEFEQVKSVTVEHTVTGSVAFYAIQVPASDDDSTLAGIRVFDADGVEYAYKYEYVDIEPGELCYHVEVNAAQQPFVRFGDGVTVGHLPADGDVYTVVADYSLGGISVEVDDPFEFEYTLDPIHDNEITMQLLSVSDSGSPPPSLDYVRELCKYPAIYDEDAVYAGEFDLLLRKHFPDALFLSVWNEAVEELHRGYNLANTNSIFVAVFRDVESTVEDTDSNILLSGSLTPYQQEIGARIKRADDTLRPRFYQPVKIIIPMTVNVQIPTTYSTEVVAQSVRELILALYGENSTFAKRGGSIKNRVVVRQLVDGVPVLQNKDSDVSVDIDYGEGDDRPEVWSFVTSDSITVNVVSVSGSRSGWS